MIENLKRLREPLTWVVLALVVAGMGLNVWRLVSALGAMPIPEAAQLVGGDWLNITVALLLAVLVLSCWLASPATPHAALLTKVAAIVLSVGVVLTALSVVFGMWASALGVGVVLDVLGGLLDVVFKGLVAGTLWVFLHGVRAGRIETAPTQVEQADTAGPVDGQPSTWSSDAAAGTVWWTAADAAAGAPGHDRMPETEEPERR